MLIKFDDSAAVCTPSKSGSTALRVGYDWSWYHLTPHNRCDKACVPDVKVRRLIVRNPIDRYFSMYWHHTQTKGMWLFNTTPNEFVERVVAGRAEGRRRLHDDWTAGHDNRMWALTMYDYVEAWEPHETYRLEDGLGKAVDFPVQQKWCTSDTRAKRAARQPIWSELSRCNLDMFIEHIRADHEAWYGPLPKLVD